MCGCVESRIRLLRNSVNGFRLTETIRRLPIVDLLIATDFSHFSLRNMFRIFVPFRFPFPFPKRRRRRKEFIWMKR